MNPSVLMMCALLVAPLDGQPGSVSAPKSIIRSEWSSGALPVPLLRPRFGPAPRESDSDANSLAFLARGQNSGGPAYNPFGPNPATGGPGMMGQDPFLMQPQPWGPGMEGGIPPGMNGVYGVNGPQPYRFGFEPRFDIGYIAPSVTQNPSLGKMEIVEYNAELRYTTPLASQWIFNTAPQFNARSWEGPTGVALPGSVFRFGWDFNLTRSTLGPLTWQFGFNPSINSDFQSGLGRQAWNLDAQAAALYRIDANWMLVLGVMYWDRVDDILLPQGGVVWTPDDRWELRLLFPKGRISYFLGNFLNGSHWLYVSSEYHVESYQIDVPTNSREQIQLRDWRFMLGLRSDHYYYEKFIEVGAVVGREVDFRGSTPGFDLAEQFVARFGFRF